MYESKQCYRRKTCWTHSLSPPVRTMPPFRFIINVGKIHLGILSLTMACFTPLRLEDHNGFNSGSMFFRVDPRSLRLAKKVVSFWPWPLDLPLWLAEQDAMKIVFKKEKLVTSGQVVFMRQESLNSYWGEAELSGSNTASTAAMIHFPSKTFKRRELFPLLQKTLAGTAPSLSLEDARQRNYNLRQAATAFWSEYRRERKAAGN